MSQAAPSSETPTLTERVEPVETGAAVAAIGWMRDTLALALADGGVVLSGATGMRRVAAHPDGAVLVTATAKDRFVTGGDDGRLVVTKPDGTSDEIAATGGGWIDAVALHPGGGLAYSAGRKVTALDDKGRTKTFEAPSTARGLVFAPKGFRLAIAHYGGATLWYPNLDAKPDALDWKGSHLDVVWSPDGRFVVTSMQENAMHGWRLAPDRGHMRMAGYSAKPRSLSWSYGGAWLATSGADAAIAWPFDSKEGPTGKAPRECGVRPVRVTQVAFHPNVNVLAIGYQDGCVLLVRFQDGAELVVSPAVQGSAVTALGWSGGGDELAFGCEDGRAGRLKLG